MDGLIVDWGTCAHQLAHQPAHRHVLTANTQPASRSHSKGTCCAVTPEPEWVEQLRDHSMLLINLPLWRFSYDSNNLVLFPSFQILAIVHIGCQTHPANLPKLD